MKKPSEPEKGAGKEKERADLEDLVNDLIGAPSSREKSGTSRQPKTEEKKDEQEDGAQTVQVVAKYVRIYVLYLEIE